VRKKQQHITQLYFLYIYIYINRIIKGVDVYLLDPIVSFFFCPASSHIII